MIKSFTAHLINEQKNTHMMHLEDQVIYGGVKGARDAILALRSLRDMLAGNSTKSVDVTVKWDGAPAIICGIDPADGQFFVGTKSVFAKDAKLMKTQKQIQETYSGGLAEKLSAALKYLPSVVTKGVLQFLLH